MESFQQQKGDEKDVLLERYETAMAYVYGIADGIRCLILGLDIIASKSFYALRQLE